MTNVNYVKDIQTIGSVNSAIRYLLLLQGHTETFYIKNGMLTKLNNKDRVKKEFTEEVKNRILLDYQEGNFSEGQVITMPFYSKVGYRLIDNEYIKQAFEKMKRSEKKAEEVRAIYKKLEDKTLSKEEILQSIARLEQLRNEN